MSVYHADQSKATYPNSILNLRLCINFSARLHLLDVREELHRLHTGQFGVRVRASREVIVVHDVAPRVGSV